MPKTQNDDVSHIFKIKQKNGAISDFSNLNLIKFTY